MIEKILVYIFDKVGIDFYKIKKLLDNIDFKEEDGKITLTIQTRMEVKKDVTIASPDVMEIQQNN